MLVSTYFLLSEYLHYLNIDKEVTFVISYLSSMFLERNYAQATNRLIFTCG